MKHPHAEFIAEAMQDTSRKIELRLKQFGDYAVWAECILPVVIAQTANVEFRFSDTVKPRVVSSLSNIQISMLFTEPYVDSTSRGRAIADAAAQEERRYICSKRKTGVSQLENETINRFLDDLLAGTI